MQNKIEILLFFGTFNPIHNGHLALASYFTEFCGIREVWFVITPQNPFKQNQILLGNRERQHLVNLGIGDYPKFRASDIEFNLPKPNYTVNTLAYIGEKFPDKKFSLLIGGDNLETFHKWKNYKIILENHKLYVYKRPGAIIPNLNDFGNADIEIVDAPMMEISSSFIRKAIKEYRDVRYFMPEKVYKYIKDMRYYL
ncbi:MAG: nicotinate (nicotinamide) nucleotide adenylyltransferase [Bacteroidales bacterium]|jgi:nicotinate-nucleotide adenylyltransferase|nr:nicotinate (nicotinamide) nucleotide adenylyltransferase [Bacteroidales bacterium]MCK9498652.1 nicotinate (nicotinamide) nucleotide adenylyltransferase [Bacteroidales bacterium]